MSLDPYSKFRKIFGTPLRRGVLASLLALSAVLLPFLLVPFEDFRLGDEAYQAYCCAHYERAYLGLLSFYIGNVWMKLFGTTYISLRVLMTICYILSAAIGCVYVRAKGFSWLKTSAVFFVGVFGLILSYLPLYGWDSGAYPYTAFGLLATLLYLDRPCIKYAVLMGLAAGLMTASRLPLLLVLPIMAVVVIYASLSQKRLLGENRHLNPLTNIGVILIVACAVFVLLITIIVGHPARYADMVTAENTVAAHNLSDIPWIVDRCVQHAYNAYIMMLPGCVAVLLAAYYAKARKIPILLLSITVLLLYFSIRGAMWNIPDFKQLFWSNSGLVIPAAFIAIFFTPLYKLIGGKAEKKTTITSIAVIVSFGLLQAAGSNSAFERVGWGLALIFAFGVNGMAFGNTRRFTFYFISFTALILAGFFALKLKYLNQNWTEPIELRYATAFNGTRPYAREYFISESVDSMKFICDKAEALGYSSMATGCESNCFNFPIGEKGENSGIRFDVTPEDAILDFKTHNAKGPTDFVFCLNVEDNSVFSAFLSNEGYEPYQVTHFPKLRVWVKDSLISKLPENPYKEWGYMPRTTN